jgi:hypothetical protein
MYAKLFNSIVSSSIWSAPKDTKIMWITMLAMGDRDGFVWGAIPGLSRLAALTIEETRAAVEELEGPDPDSSDPNNEGRRIERVDGGWRIINYEKYRDMEREDDRRAAARMKKRRQRGQTGTVPKCHTSDSDSDTDTKREREIARKRFEPPTTEEARAFFEARHGGDPMPFLAFYESNGWKVGKNGMKNWKAAAAGWIMRNGNGSSHVR